MGTVFNIQHFSIHDGPGIRTVVFLKGCPLRCRWCANPESQSPTPQIGWTKGECIHCNGCLNGIKDLNCRFEEDDLFWDTTAKCDAKEVKRVCPTGALHLMGEEMTAGEVMEEVEKDAPFFIASGGGITISGGEPLLQPDFTCEILKLAGKRNMHRAIESCSYAPWEDFKKVLHQVDYLLTDVKTMDDETHKKQTGVSNELILENLRRVRKEFPYLPIHVRTPVIPGVNDSKEDIEAILAFVYEIRANYELLPYHRLGVPKYESLHRVYPMGNAELDTEKYMELETCAVMSFAQRPLGGQYGPPKTTPRGIDTMLMGGAGI